jgi:hypothetical protein
MIRATSRPDGPFMTVNASVSGAVVYLDNWALGDLAEGDPSRQKRFTGAMRSGLGLLFSVTNAAELSGPQGRSADAIRAFLDEIGPHWFPVELDQTEVVKRELSGADPGNSCVSEALVKSYVTDRMSAYLPGSGKVIELSADFFSLGAVLDWVGPQRDSIRKGSAEMDEALRSRIGEYTDKSRGDATWLNEKFPSVPFNPHRRATFTYVNLVRTLIVEAAPLKKGDGMDFCHAVMASAFASFATLDRRWKRRVEDLPKPNGLARIYSGPGLNGNGHRVLRETVVPCRQLILVNQAINVNLWQPTQLSVSWRSFGRRTASSGHLGSILR